MQAGRCGHAKPAELAKAARARGDVRHHRAGACPEFTSGAGGAGAAGHGPVGAGGGCGMGAVWRAAQVAAAVCAGAAGRAGRVAGRRGGAGAELCRRGHGGAGDRPAAVGGGGPCGICAADFCGHAACGGGAFRARKRERPALSAARPRPCLAGGAAACVLAAVVCVPVSRHGEQRQHQPAQGADGPCADEQRQPRVSDVAAGRVPPAGAVAGQRGRWGGAVLRDTGGADGLAAGHAAGRPAPERGAALAVLDGACVLCAVPHLPGVCVLRGQGYQLCHGGAVPVADGQARGG